MERWPGYLSGIRWHECRGDALPPLCFTTCGRKENWSWPSQASSLRRTGPEPCVDITVELALVEVSPECVKEGQLAQPLVGCSSWESGARILLGSTVKLILEVWVQVSQPQGHENGT